MAQIEFRVNLSATTFPLLTSEFGRTVLIPGMDQNFLYGFGGSTSREDDRGVAQSYYMHNVLPTARGYTSVGFKQQALPVVGAGDFDKLCILRDINENKVYYVPANGKNYIANGNSGQWQSFPFANITTNPFVTVAYIHGHTYVCFRGQGVYQYDAAANTFTAVTLTALDPLAIDGICAANNYLIAWTRDTVYWSSDINELDFTPSLSTSAASTKVQQLRGAITSCLPLADGFMVYTSANAIASVYSGNTQFPWIFREVPGSAGVITPEQVSYDSNYSSHFAWTTSGLMEITKTAATPIYPEITDFLIKGIIEDYDTVSDKYIITKANVNPLKIKICYVGTRYLAISYGISEYTHVLILDNSLGRWGRLKLSHVDVFEGVELTPYSYTQYQQIEGSYASQAGKYSDYTDSYVSVATPHSGLSILCKDGSIYSVVFDSSVPITDSVLVLGKYQLARNRTVVMQGVKVESANAAVPTVKLVSSLDGKNANSTTSMFLARNDANYQEYNCRMSGVNHSLVFEGDFNLVNIQLVVIPGGNR